MRGPLIATFTLLLLVSGCIYYTSPAGQQYGQNSPPVIAAFSAVPASVAPGSPSTLAWTVTNAASVSIDQGIGSVPTTGTRGVSPASTATYSMTASNPYGTVTATALVVVNAQSSGGLPVVTQFYAAPETISPGDSSTLNWNVANATSVFITGFGQVPPIGTRTIYPSTTMTYTLTANNEIGTSTSLLQIAVAGTTYGATGGQGLPLIQEFRARPDVVSRGVSTVLTWRVENATSIDISGIGSVPAIGSQSITPYATISYIITAGNAYGTTTSSTLIVVQ
jgi:hypothetical protein